MTLLSFILYGILFFIAYVLIWGWWRNGYYRRRGINGPPAYVPFVGNAVNTFWNKKHFKDFFDDIYKRYPDEKYVGIIQFGIPMVIIQDIEILKQICIKDFDHFLDHQGTLSESGDLLFGKSLFTLQGQKWRDMRATLSPAFTSSKMRGMFQYIVDCGEGMTDYYMEQMKIEENKARGLLELEMRDVFTRYTNDVIATCAFGLNCDSFTDRNNLFYEMGKEATNFSGFLFMKFILMLIFPNLSQILRLKFLSDTVSNFFRNLVWDTIKDREDRNIVRNDMIQLLMEARKGTLKHDSHEKDGKDTGFATVEESSLGKTVVKREWEDDDIVAQALQFFAAGFDTSSILACFLAHELALHPEIQRRLQEEIDEVAADLDGKLTYDCIQKMKYMDMVVSETLRMWPPAAGTDRKCIKTYTLPPPNKESTKGLTVYPGNSIQIPINSIHHDPKYFEDPEKFDPERFSDENKHKIIPGTYFPFGLGPRNCIGSRFALMEAKAVMFSLLLKFDFVTTAKTQHPIQIKTDTINIQAQKGFWIGFKPRMK